MEIERKLESLRLRLLRLVAGLLVAVMFASGRPISSALSRWITRAILPLVPCAEAAARHLAIAQARIIADRRGSAVDLAGMPDADHSGQALWRSGETLGDLRKRLFALLAMLEDLPRHGACLLRRAEKRLARHSSTRSRRRTGPAVRGRSALRPRRRTARRIERPPDKSYRRSLKEPPIAGFALTSPRKRAGGESGCAGSRRLGQRPHSARTQ